MDKQQIINFVVNNDNLELLQARMKRFNPLKVLKVQDHEIRYSNVLAWLFDPKENHNLDDKILKRFILKVLQRPENEEILEEMNMVYEIQQAMMIDVCVYRELNNIDLVLVSEQNKIVMFIENKVYSGEHSNQLKRYYQIIFDAYPDYRLVPIFLTLDGKEASYAKYFSASYSDILETIEFIIEHYKDRTTDDVIKFVEYYLRILKEKYVMDDELKKLCKDIYVNNKEVIDMIYSVGNEIDMENAINLFRDKHNSLITISEKPKQYWFALEEFEVSRIGELDGWGAGFPIAFWFSEYYGKMKITLEVGPFADASMRIRFLVALEEQGIKISDRAKQPGKKYTRIYTDTVAVKDWTDTDELNDAMEKLFGKHKVNQIIPQVIEAIKGMDWDK